MYLFQGVAYIEKAMFNDAISAFEKLVTLSGGSPFAVGYLGYAYAMSGKSGDASQMLDRLDKLSEEWYVSPFWRAIIYLGLGKKNETFEYLQKAYHERESFLVFLKCLPIFDCLHSDSRFIALLRRIGLER